MISQIRVAYITKCIDRSPNTGPSVYLRNIIKSLLIDKNLYQL